MSSSHRLHRAANSHQAEIDYLIRVRYDLVSRSQTLRRDHRLRMAAENARLKGLRAELHVVQDQIQDLGALHTGVEYSEYRKLRRREAALHGLIDGIAVGMQLAQEAFENLEDRRAENVRDVEDMIAEARSRLKR
ncbi:hypothetical protein RUND412_010873 [Rhizina undulata]